MKRIGIALALWLTVTCTAFAQDPDDFTEYDFEDDLILGDLVRPDGQLVSASPRFGHTSLIRIRDNFIEPLIWSIDGL